jgi:putative transposase
MSVRHQCDLLSVSRSKLYRQPAETPAVDLALMRELDELYLNEPTWGGRKLSQFFANMGRVVCRKRIVRLRRLMGIETIYQRPRTSIINADHQRFPYQLRGLKITQPDHVWCADITYVPMARGSLYLFAIMDWASRKVIAWEISNSLDESCCLRCLGRALTQSSNRKPMIFNTDQGSQFTGKRWIELLQGHGIIVSHDGKGRWMDNVMIERLWRSVKYDDIYLKAYADGHELHVGLTAFFERYDNIRPHASLDGQTPAHFYSQQPAFCSAGDPCAGACTPAYKGDPVSQPLPPPVSQPLPTAPPAGQGGLIAAPLTPG